MLHLLLAGLPKSAIVLLVVLVAVWRLPAFGHRVLTFLRDLRSYRAGR
jgi:hypothetical protein